MNSPLSTIRRLVIMREYETASRRSMRRRSSELGALRCHHPGRTHKDLSSTYSRARGSDRRLSKGRTGEGFDKLDKFGAIQEIADASDRLAAIAETHIEALEAQRSSLIIEPTHGECRSRACAVRKAMKEKSLLLDSEHSLTRLQRLNLTDSQRRDAVTCEPGQIVEFHRMSKGVVRRGVQEKRFKSGEQWEVLRRQGWRREAVLDLSAPVSDKEILCLYWPLGTVVIAGPKVLELYAGFCAHRATCLKADGKDIKVLNLILSGNSDGASETDPSTDLKPENRRT
jgi:hypothetical protein